MLSGGQGELGFDPLRALPCELGGALKTERGGEANASPGGAEAGADNGGRQATALGRAEPGRSPPGGTREAEPGARYTTALHRSGRATIAIDYGRHSKNVVPLKGEARMS